MTPNKKLRRTTASRPLNRNVRRGPQNFVCLMRACPGRDRPLPSCSGPPHEWHVDFSKAFQHITFGLPSWFHETIVWFGSTFFSARLITVGPIGDAMDRDGVKQLLVEVHADCQVMLALESNHWLEGFERLDRSLEAD